MKISETKFRMETPYGVKKFQNFHFQKHAPNMQKRLAKKFQQNSIQPSKQMFHLLFQVSLIKQIYDLRTAELTKKLFS